MSKNNAGPSGRSPWPPRLPRTPKPRQFQHLFRRLPPCTQHNTHAELRYSVTGHRTWWFQHHDGTRLRLSP